ncbi:MAG: sigma-70 family RNA polymerase sigma factor [Bacteroidetes bacterium]|nr:sigma-70 family RNA polymerase sigma factor [Bacteroidota bacterium]
MKQKEAWVFDLAIRERGKISNYLLERIHDELKYKVFAFCRKIAEDVFYFDDPEEMAKDLYQHAWMKFYMIKEFYIKRYKTGTHLRHAIIKWLTKSAYGYAADLLTRNLTKSFSSLSSNYDFYDKISNTLSTEYNIKEAESEKQSVVRDILDSLNERELDIVIITIHYKPHNIPKEEREKICSKYNITEENFRKIKERVMKKIEEKIKSLIKLYQQ